MAPQLRRRPVSIVTTNEAVEDPQDLGEPINPDDYSINSPNSPNFNPDLPSYPVIAPPPRTALTERFIARPRLPSPSPSPAHPPPLPLHDDHIFKNPRAPENYLDPFPSDNEADDEPEKDQNDELLWQQVRKLPFEEQDSWHKRRIQKRKQEYQDVMDQPIKTQRDHPHMSAQERRKAATERKNLLNAKQMQVTRAEASYRDLLARHHQGQHHPRKSPGDQFKSSFTASSPITSSQNRFFPRGRQLGSDHSPSSSPSSEDLEAGSSSEKEEEGDAGDGSGTSPRSKHSPRPPALSDSYQASRRPGKSRQEHEAIIQELDRQMKKLKAERRQEVEKTRKERRERNKNDDLKKNQSTKRDSRKGPEAHKYNNGRQSIYQRKKRAEDAYERDFPDYSERRTTPRELEKHKWAPRVKRRPAGEARHGRTT